MLRHLAWSVLVVALSATLAFALMALACRWL